MKIIFIYTCPSYRKHNKWPTFSLTRCSIFCICECCLMWHKKKNRLCSCLTAIVTNDFTSRAGLHRITTRQPIQCSCAILNVLMHNACRLPQNIGLHSRSEFCVTAAHDRITITTGRPKRNAKFRIISLAEGSLKSTEQPPKHSNQSNKKLLSSVTQAPIFFLN